MPLKHNGVKHFIKVHQLDVICVLETKLNREKLEKIMLRKFKGWCQFNNFDLHYGGRILLLWNPLTVNISLVQSFEQAIFCKATCKVTHHELYISFVYGLHSIVNRRELWDSILNFGLTMERPWLVLGDFNTILTEEERINGAHVTPYEIRDFSNVCMQCGLVDLQSVGWFFTWSKNSTWTKLDRAMVNNAWMCSGFQGLASFLPPGSLSDHSPCIVSIFQQQHSSRKPFKFFNFWVKNDDFLSIVQQSWGEPIIGSKQFILCKSLQRLKHPLKVLNNKHYSHISARVERINCELLEAQQLLYSQPNDGGIQELVGRLRQSANALSEAERLFYSQQAKWAYLINADKGTKFFHDLAKRHAKRNFIAAVRLADGSLSSSPGQVVDAFVSHYKALLGSFHPVDPIDLSVLQHGPMVTDDLVHGLQCDISRLEIKEALFSIGDDKSPGPDGYSALFFKSTWDVIGDDFSQAVGEFFHTGHLLKQINHSVIVQVPKRAHADSVNDYRPISCCNVTYKVISKILANRLAKVLDPLVDKAQSAFIKGRSMVDCIHLSQELLRKYNRKRVSPRCCIKIDLRKAYDTVSWDFLRQVLQGLGFPNQFVGWIMECVTTAAYSISLNGCLHDFFKGKRGLRQGDPLSPYLFVLCLEYLSRLINLATTNSDFNFHPKCGHLGITHLAFADDVILFSRGDIPSVSILMDCLQVFRSKSGLAVSADKSSLFSAGINVQIFQQIKVITGFSTGSMPFRYLGVPLAAEKLKVLHYGPLTNQISECIKAWAGLSLSYAGRAQLIQAVLQGIQCFWLSIMPIPNAVIQKVVGMCRAYLWQSKFPLVAWREVCLPKSEGGLGFRDLLTWNFALLARTLWDIHAEKDSLWIKWVHHEYLRNVSIWERARRKDDSPLFKRILEIRDRLIQQEGSLTAAIMQLLDWNIVGKFSSVKAYQYFRPKGQRWRVAKAIWAPAAVPKHAFVLWLAAKRKLRTKDALPFALSDSSCAFCGEQYESSHHLFFMCPLSSDVWTQIREWLCISPDLTTLNGAIIWVSKHCRGSSVHCKARRAALASTVYHLWNARNRCIFEGSWMNSDIIIRKIKTHVYNVLYALYPDVLAFPHDFCVDQ